jgi:hypothetical protein
MVMRSSPKPLVPRPSIVERVLHLLRRLASPATPVRSIAVLTIIIAAGGVERCKILADRA